MIHTDAVALEAGDGLVAKHILTDAGDQCDVAARASRANGLVGAFATGSGDELAAEDGFARPRDAVELDDHVGVRTADDYNRG